MLSDSMEYSSGLFISKDHTNPASGGYASDHHIQINQNSMYEWAWRKGSSACLTWTLMWTNPRKTWDTAAKPANDSCFVEEGRQLLVLSSSHGKKRGVGFGWRFRSPCQCLQNIRAEWNMGSLAKKYFKRCLPWKTGAGILSACAIHTYAHFSLTYTK